MKDKDLGLQLISSIKGKRIEEINWLLENPNTDLNAQDEGGCTPLHWAFFKKDNALFIKLLQKGVNMDEKDKDGYSVLHFACIRGDVEIIKALIEYKADVNIRDNQKMSPLHYACIKNNTEAMNILIDSEGFEAKALDISLQKVFTKVWKNGHKNGHKDIVQKLIEDGMKPSVEFMWFLWSNDGRDIVQKSAKITQEENIKFVISVLAQDVGIIQNEEIYQYSETKEEDDLNSMGDNKNYQYYEDSDSLE